jgi:hypothetical protein
LAYFLSRCLEGLQKHKKHRLAPEKIGYLLAGLGGLNRRKALCARFDLESACLLELLNSWCAHICTFVEPGSISAADEAVLPYWGKKADDDRELQQIEGKPHDYGLIAYIEAQRLQHTGLPIAIAFLINHIRRSWTPTQCVLELHRALLAANPAGPAMRQLVLDSLWSDLGCINQFDQHGVHYSISLKPSSAVIPASLHKVASSDLPLHASRTYSNGVQTLEVVNAGKHTVSIVSNMYNSGAPLHLDRVTKGDYKTAVHLFDKESAAELVSIFGIDAQWATRPKEDIIYHHLGWDVLRPPHQQGTNAPLTFTDAESMKVSQLKAIRAQMLPRARHSTGTKDSILCQLFPREQREADAEQAAAQDRTRKRRTREKLQDLALLRENVRVYFFVHLLFWYASPSSRLGARMLTAHLCGTYTIPTTMPSIA